MRIHVLMPNDKVRPHFLPEDCVRALNEAGDTRWNPLPEHYAGEALTEILRESDIVVTGWGCPRVGKDTLPEGAKLRLLVHTAGTVAPFVDETTFARGIKVCTANDFFAESVAEGTIAYMLASLRRIPFWSSEVQQKRWHAFEDVVTRGLLGRTVGIVGFGAIARHLASMLKAFGTRIMVHADHVTPEECERYGIEKVSLAEIAACDVITLHNSLTPETEGMIGEEFLSGIRDGALFINTARGRIVDEAALYRALAGGRFQAVLDVYENEPLPLDSPLRGLPNVILMPHIAGPTADRRAVCGREMVKEIQRFIRGEPLLHQVTEAAALRMTR